MKFCGMCGTRLTQICPICGFANPLPYRFCGQCGARLPDQLALPQQSQLQLPLRAPAEGPPVPQFLSLGEPSIPAQAAPAPAALEGERRHATVILADVRRSMDLLEQIGTEAWVEMMNHVFQILEAEIYRFGGEVDQFRGDALVAFFGATVVHEDDPERAVLAALAMQRVLNVYAAELAEQRGIELLLRIGVNTGEVIVASIGDSSRHSEDTAMGGAVALAARMESAAEPGTVLVSENTYHLVQSQFEWKALGEIAVKGVSRPVTVYRPLAPRADGRRSLRLKPYGLSSLLVGRDEPFNSLKRCIEDLRAGRGGVVTLTGDEGMGKSHLVAQVRQQDMRVLALLAKTRGSDDPADFFPMLTWLQGRCRSYEQSRPYSMWLDLLQEWLGVGEGESKEKTRDRLRTQAEELWGDRLDEYYPYMATFLSLPLEEAFAARVRHLDAGELRQQLFLTLRGWVETMAERGPLVLSFEDVHWVDATSLELLECCLPLCERQALLWLIMFRLGRGSTIGEFHRRVETQYPHRLIPLVLLPLTEAQSGEMIDRLIGSGGLPEETRALIISKAEGNPYYIEELIHSLIRKGMLVRDERTGQWKVTRAVTSLDVPDTLRGLLLASMDSLSSEERHVLQMAAVIGAVFWSNVLQELIDDQGTLEQHLASLQGAQLIQERGRVPELGTEYVFKSMMRDAAYESLLNSLRVTYHLKVAEYLEGFFGLDTLPRYYDLLAYHYRCAGDANKELFYTLQAAEKAKGIYSNAEALRHYTRTLELLDQMEAQTVDETRLYVIRTQQFEVLNGRREVFFALGDSVAGRADAQALLPLARQLDDDPAWLIDALLQQPGVAGWQTMEELEAGVPMAQQSLDLARESGDRRREMLSLVAAANQRMGLNDPESGWELTERALELARELGDQDYKVALLVGLGRVFVWNDQLERGAAYLEAALPLSQALDDKRTEMNLLELIGMQFERSGDYYRLLIEYHQKRLQISRRIEHRPLQANALMHCGQIQGIYLGDHKAALAMLEESRDIFEGSAGEMFALLRIVQILVAQKRYDEALQALERARHVAERRVLMDMGHAGLRLVSAILYNAMGDEAHLHEALRFTAETCQLVAGSPSLSRQYEMAAACESAVAYLGLAECVEEAARQEHCRQALASSQAAVDLYQALRGVQVIECTSEEILYRYSRALAANGRPSEAAAYLERAHEEMMRKCDLIPPDSPFRDTYLENIPLHRDIRTAYAARST
jgi:class 3 adenylate cyclase/tetratricopeptide (TPR) repeat protein